MPVDPAALDSAIWWYEFSGQWLIGAGALTAIAACITIALAFIQWRSNNTIEAHNEWRTASLELQTEQAKLEQERLRADLAKSLEHTAELEKGIADARAAVMSERKARVMLQRDLSARTLDDRKREALTDAWRAFAGRKVSVFAYLADPESTNLAVQIMECLEEAGLVVDDQTSSNTQLGVFISHILVGGPDVPLVKIVSNALVSVGLETSIGAPPPTGNATLDPSDASIFVGSKPMPPIPAPKLMQTP
ncbi:MAG: hypothetical protein WED13_04410 [Methyloceanibacter sp.]